MQQALDDLQIQLDAVTQREQHHFAHIQQQSNMLEESREHVRLLSEENEKLKKSMRGKLSWQTMVWERK